MMKKQILSIMLILCMALTLLPVPASAVTVNALHRVINAGAEFSPYPDQPPSGYIPYGTNIIAF
jgi:hypothetical protein